MPTHHHDQGKEVGKTLEDGQFVIAVRGNTFRGTAALEVSVAQFIASGIIGKADGKVIFIPDPVMDFTAVTVSDSYRYPAELAKLPIKENRLASAREELVKGLKNGDKVSVTVKLNGKESNYYITAGDKGLNPWDKSGKKLTLQELTGQAKKVGKAAGQSNTNALKTDRKATPQNNVKTIKLSKGVRISR